MKSAKLINLSTESIERLKKADCNASALIEGLLQDYWKKHDIDFMNEQELRKYIALEEAKEAYQIKVQEIENGDY